MVSARKRLDGQVSLAQLTRLQGLLVDFEGKCDYALDFCRDETLRVSYVQLTLETELPLICQRTLQRYLHPISMVQRFGLIRDEADEAALPEGYEALLVAEDGYLKPLDLVEDELVLAVPLVPVSPGSEAIEREWEATTEEVAKVNPFAALASLKKQ